MDKKQKINNMLKNYKRDGLIKDYGLTNFSYWQSVPYIELNNGNKIILAKTEFIYKSLGIKTIYDYNVTYIKDVYIKNIFNNQDLFDKYYIKSYGDLLNVLEGKKI